MPRRLSAEQRLNLYYPRVLPPEEVRDFRRVKPPGRLAQRARDERGFVIPYSVDDGTLAPDFRVTNADRVRELLETQSCWLCGRKRDRYMCFLGGPISVENHLFSDGWMHEGCAVYALRVCPYLSRPSGRYNKTEQRRIQIRPQLGVPRPAKFGMAYTRSFTTILDEDGSLYLRSAPYWKIHWFSAWGRLLGISSGRWEQSYDTRWKKQKLARRKDDGTYEDWRARENARLRAHRHKQAEERRRLRSEQT